MVGGYQSFFGLAFVQAICGVVALKPHVPSGACGARSYGLSGVLSYLARFRPPAGTAFPPFFRGLPFLRPQSGAQCDCYPSGRPHFFFLAQVIRRPAAAIVLCRPRASSGLELDPFHPIIISGQHTCMAQNVSWTICCGDARHFWMVQ